MQPPKSGKSDQKPENRQKMPEKAKKGCFLNSAIAKNLIFDVRKPINRQFERNLLSDFNLNFT